MQYENREEYAKYAIIYRIKMQYSQSNLINYEFAFMIQFLFGKQYIQQIDLIEILSIELVYLNRKKYF